MRLKLNTKILLGFSIAVVTLLLTSATSYWSIRQLQFHTDNVERSLRVLQQIETLNSVIARAETSVRGYRLTDDSLYLRGYRTAPALLQTGYARAHALIRNPRQQQRLDSLQFFIKWKLGILRQMSVKNEVPVGAPLRAALDEDRQLSARLRGVAGRFRAEQLGVLQQRAQQQQLYERTTPIAVVASAVLAVIIVLLLFRRISEELNANLALQEELTRTHADTTRRIGIIENLAEQVVQGDYKVKIKDQEKDSVGNLASSLNRMTQNLDEAFSALQNRNRELDQFAYVASHDLKAPLRGINAVVKWIEEELPHELSAQMKQYLGMMKGRLSRLEDLINGLLAYARIGRTAPKVEEVSVGSLVSEIAELVVPDDFQLQITNPLPTFQTDRLSLQQVFTNLISNAVKYHDQGSGTITIGCRETKKSYVFSVTDDGPGIAPEYHEKIFLMFQTLRDRNTAESTGIGLSIVKKIIDEQKGRIDVKSAPGEGATFIFTWPKAPIASPTT